jgi:hypothetical protein
LIERNGFYRELYEKQAQLDDSENANGSPEGETLSDESSATELPASES